MEITVPIIDNSEDTLDGKSKRGNKSSPKRDVDVQQCLDTYLFPESLEGDNSEC